LTEGIIQKVIARYVKKGYDTDPQAWHIRKKVLPELQQDLIAEIKKTFPHDRFSGLTDYNLLMKYLIGGY
jgi:hypothetical protein